MSDTLELQIISHDAGSLVTNAKGILDAVRLKLTGYKAEKYSGENIQAAKDDKAALNKSAKTLADARIQLERAHMASISEGLAIIKQAEAEIKTASGLIDVVVKEVEAREKAEKEKALREYFDSLGTELVTFAQIFQAEWANKSTSLKAGKASIAARVAQIKSELETVQAFGDEAVTAFFLKSLSLSAAMKMAADLKAGRERAAKIEADRLAKAAEVHPIIAPIVATVAPQVQQAREAIAETRAPEPVQTFQPPVMPELSAPELLTRTFRVVTTAANLGDLVEWMTGYNIDWEKVEA